MSIFSQKDLIQEFKVDKRPLLRNMKPHIKEGEDILVFYPLLTYPSGADSWMSTIGRLLFIFGLKHYVFCITNKRILLFHRKRKYFSSVENTFTNVQSFNSKRSKLGSVRVNKNTSYMKFVSRGHNFLFCEVHNKWVDDIKFHYGLVRMIE